MHPSTALVRFDAAPGDPNRPTSTPIHQTATFAQASADGFGRYDYTRSDNPTRAVLEAQLARLEGAERALCFASGLAALTTLVSTVPSGGHILAGDDLYGGTFRLLERVAARAGVRTTYADAADLGALERGFEPNTRLVLVELPTNPLQHVCDVRALAKLAHARGARLAVDASMLTPLRVQPLALGADVVWHSATKYLSGHGDVTAGVLATRASELGQELAFLRNAQGNALAPFESWLCLRGLKTLALRLACSERNARGVARMLERHPHVTRVHYVGLRSHPGHALLRAQASGCGSVVSFETGSLEYSKRVVEALALFTIAVSFGSVASQANLPGCTSHQSIPEGARSFPSDLVRLSIGIEDQRDLVHDLERALALSPAAVPCVS